MLATPIGRLSANPPAAVRTEARPGACYDVGDSITFSMEPRHWIAPGRGHFRADVAAEPAPAASGDRALSVSDADALSIARQWGLVHLASREFSAGVWEIEGSNSAGVAMEVVIDATSGSVLAVDDGHPSPRSR